MEKANVLKDGDIIACTTSSGPQWIGIFKQYGERGLADIHYCIDIYGDLCEGIENFHLGDYHLATEDEKEKLFIAIKDNGYKWNAETKTLERLNIVTEHIEIVENREIVREVSITFPKEWNVTDSDEVEGFFSIVVLRYAPHRMEALAEALKKLGVIGEPIGALFRLSPEWEISNCDHMTHTITLQKYEYSYEYQKKIET